MIACLCVQIVSAIGGIVLLAVMGWCTYQMFKKDDTLFY